MCETTNIEIKYYVGESAESSDIGKLAMSISYFICLRGDIIKCPICRQILVKLMKAVKSAKLIGGHICGSLDLTAKQIEHLRCSPIMRASRDGGRLYDEIYDLMVSIRQNLDIPAPEPIIKNYHL